MKPTEAAGDTQGISIVLEEAYCWQCPQCGAENFCRSELLEISAAEKRVVMAKAEGIDVEEIILSDEELDAMPFACNPSKVKCFGCEIEYPVAEFSEIDIQTGLPWEG
jgi:hypothetical protein